MGRECSTYNKRRSAYTILVGKSEKKRPLGRPKRRWGDNMKMDIQEVGCGICTGFIWLKLRTDDGLL